MVDNPKYEELLSRYKHLQGVKTDDDSDKDKLPIHVVLGVNKYTAIKTSTAPRVGNVGKLIGERTKHGWIVLSPGREDVASTLLLTSLTSTAYEQLCS